MFGDYLSRAYPCALRCPIGTLLLMTRRWDLVFKYDYQKDEYSFTISSVVNAFSSRLVTYGRFVIRPHSKLHLIKLLMQLPRVL